MDYLLDNFTSIATDRSTPTREPSLTSLHGVTHIQLGSSGASGRIHILWVSNPLTWTLSACALGVWYHELTYYVISLRSAFPRTLLTLNGLSGSRLDVARKQGTSFVLHLPPRITRHGRTRLAAGPRRNEQDKRHRFGSQHGGLRNMLRPFMACLSNSPCATRAEDCASLGKFALIWIGTSSLFGEPHHHHL